MLKAIRDFFNPENKPFIPDWEEVLEPLSEVTEKTTDQPETSTFHSPRVTTSADPIIVEVAPLEDDTIYQINYTKLLSSAFPFELAEEVFEFWVEAFALDSGERRRVEALLTDVLVNRYHYNLKFEWRLLFQAELMPITTFVFQYRKYHSTQFFQAILEAHFLLLCMLSRYEFKNISVHKVGLLNLIQEELKKYA